MHKILHFIKNEHHEDRDIATIAICIQFVRHSIKNLNANMSSSITYNSNSVSNQSVFAKSYDVNELNSENRFSFKNYPQSASNRNLNRNILDG